MLRLAALLVILCLFPSSVAYKMVLVRYPCHLRTLHSPDCPRTRTLHLHAKDDNRRLSEKIEEAGGFKEWVADELTKDRTEGAVDTDSKASSELPELKLSPVAKERKRKADELNEMVTKGVRASGAFLTVTTFALLLLAKQYGLTDQ